MLERKSSWSRSVLLVFEIAAIVLVLAIVWVLFVPAADWLAQHDVGSAKGALHETALDNARGRLLTLGAGLVAGGALVFTALNFNLLRRNSEQADQWQRSTQLLTEHGQVTDRYTKAIAQLGDENLDVRIGGIYALERVARDSRRDHPTVMEVLTAYIRDRSHKQGPPSDPTAAEPDRSTQPDVEAALTVVGRRDATRDIRSIDLTGAILHGAHLARMHPARMHPARMHPARVDLTGADLTGAHLDGAHLDGVIFTDAIFTDAHLAGAHLGGATLIGAHLARAHLTGAHLDGVIFVDAILTGAHLGGAHLIRADLASADLASADLADADLTGADLTGAHLDGAHLDGAKWPDDAGVPKGWRLNTGSGRLERAVTGSSPTK